jgi:hypothetical protein
MFPFLLIQILRIYLLVPKSGILYFLGYTIFTNTKVENIHRQLFTNIRVRNIINRPLKHNTKNP